MKKLRTIEMERLTVEEFKEANKTPLVVVMDDVRSMHNVGSVFRTGDAFRIEAVYLCGITSTPPMAEIHKTALGAEDSVSWKYFDTALEAVEALKADGYEVYSVEQAHGSTMLQDFKPVHHKKYAFAPRKFSHIVKSTGNCQSVLFLCKLGKNGNTVNRYHLVS